MYMHLAILIMNLKSKFSKYRVGFIMGLHGQIIQATEIKWEGLN